MSFIKTLLISLLNILFFDFFKTCDNFITNLSHSNVLKNPYQITNFVSKSFINYTFCSEFSFYYQIPIFQILVRVQPKCLILFHSCYYGYEQQNNIKNILKYAWNNSFLDFTLIEKCKTNSSSSIIYDYNPFN